MRFSLLGLNALALAALIVPAFLIYNATASSMGPWAGVCLGAFGLGALSLFGAMTRLSGKRTNARGAIPLIALGAALVSVPLVMVLGMALHR
jgi:hypothetical protein